jgi:acyl carrier protein
MEQIGQRVRQFIIDNFVFGDASYLADDDSFLDNGLIDSMGILTLVVYVEKTFGIAVKDEEIVPDNWDSVNRIANFIGSKLAKEETPVKVLADKEPAVKVLANKCS